MAQGDQVVTSPGLDETMQIREATPPGLDGRRWQVTAPGDVVFVVTLRGRDIQGTPEGTPPMDRPWREDEIQRAVLWAVEKARVSLPQKKPGSRLYVDGSALDLYEANHAL